MRNPFISLCVAGGLIASLSACKKSDQTSQTNLQGPAVLLKVKWPVGSRYVYRMDLDQQTDSTVPQLPKPVHQNFTMAMTYAISVLKETPEGGRELEFEFLANEIEIKMGEQVMMSFDSKEDSKDGAKDPMTAPFRKFVGSKLRLETSADGKVTKVIGIDEWTKSITDEPTSPVGTMLSQQFNEGFFHQIADFGRAFLTTPVQVGQSWPFQLEVPIGTMGKIAIDSKVKLLGLEDHEQHHCAALDTQGTLKGTPGHTPGPMGNISIENGKLSAKSWFDPELGALIESSGDQAMHLKGETPAPPGGKAGPGIKIDLVQKVGVKLVELGKTKG